LANCYDKALLLMQLNNCLLLSIHKGLGWCFALFFGLSVLLFHWIRLQKCWQIWQSGVQCIMQQMKV